MFSIEPQNGIDKPQMNILVEHLTPAPTTSSPLADLNFVQDAHYGIVRLDLPLDQATTVANAISADTLNEAQYIHNLLSQVTTTTIPAVAVEASMYGVIGSSEEITLLATQFLPPRVEFANHYGFNSQVYASEALGLAFAFGNETGSTAFADSFGPSNPTMPDSASGDLSFAMAAASAIFGPASTANLVNAIDTWVTNWKAFFASHGIPGILDPTANQVDLAARGAAWGDAVGEALFSRESGPFRSTRH